MGRCGVVALVVLAIAGSATAAPLGQPCDCKVNVRPVPRDRALVPRNTKLWVLEQSYNAARIQRLDSDWHDAFNGTWDPKLGATVYTPAVLAPGRYAISYGEIPAGTFDVSDEVDTTPPDRPELDGATVEIADGRVEHLSVIARFAKPDDTAVVRITLDDGESSQVVATTLDRLELCDSGLKTSAKRVHLTVEAIDYAGNPSPPTTLELATTPSTSPPCIEHHYKCGLGATVGVLLGGFLLLMFVLCTTAIAVFRRIQRGTTGEPPVLVPNLVATALAKHARARDGVFLVIVAGAVVAAWSFFGEWASVGGVWALIRFSDYVVANRALKILENGLAIAELYGTNLVVRHDGKQSALLLSRGEIRYAHRAAVPTAKMT